MKKSVLIAFTAVAVMLCFTACNKTSANQAQDDAVNVAAEIDSDTITPKPIELGPDDILEFGEVQPYPIVVDFSASWCMPCKYMHPTFDKVAAKYHGKVKFIYVDIDKAPQIAKEYGITVVPTLLFVNTSGQINRVEGAMNEDEMIEATEQIMAQSPQPTGKAAR